MIEVIIEFNDWIEIENQNNVGIDNIIELSNNIDKIFEGFQLIKMITISDNMKTVVKANKNNVFSIEDIEEDVIHIKDSLIIDKIPSYSYLNWDDEEVKLMNKNAGLLDGISTSKIKPIA